MARNRWLKFFPVDWQADPALRRCSLAARGLWIECIAIMHQAEPYGHLLVNGEPPTIGELTRIVGAPHPNQVRSLLDELRRARVFSEVPWGGNTQGTGGGTPGGQGGEHPQDTPEIPTQTPPGTPTVCIVSRRMARDAEATENARETGRRGGNPTLLRDKGRVNPPVKPRVKLEAEAEAEAEAEEELPPTGEATADAAAGPAGGSKEAAKAAAKAAATEAPDELLWALAAIWNEIAPAHGLPTVADLNDKRRQKLRARIRERWKMDPPRQFRAYVERICSSPFLRGEIGTRGWRADFDWAIRSDEVVLQVREGKYHDGEPG